MIQPDLECQSSSEYWGPFEPLHFNAVAGHKYVLLPPFKAGAVSLREYEPGASRGKLIGWTGKGLEPPALIFSGMEKA